MKQKTWIGLFACVLVILSVLLLFIHYLLFNDPQMEFYYTLLDIAFVPIQVLLVTLVINQLLERRNLQMQLEKLNMVIGIFFSELGNSLLRIFSSQDPEILAVRREVKIPPDWDPVVGEAIKKKVREHQYLVLMQEIDLASLRDLLLSKEDLLIRLIENPILLEHEQFTDLLRAVFHLTEELMHRPSLSGLPESDIIHLQSDIRRAYSQMTLCWVDYLGYLKKSYPYLFSLALRTNPFLEEEDVVIRT